MLIHTMECISTSVQAKFTMAISFTVVLFFSILLFLSFRIFRNYSIEKSREYASTVLYETNSKIDLFFSEIESLANSLAGYRAVQSVNTAEMKNIFLSAVRSRKEYLRAIYLGTKQGKMYEWGIGEGFTDNSPTFPEGYDPRKRPWYRVGEKEKQFTVSQPYIYASIKALGITGVIPVYSENDTFAGVLGIDIILQGLNKIVNIINAGRDSRIILLNKNYEIIASQFESIHDNVTKLKKYPSFLNIRGSEGTFTDYIASEKMFVSYKVNSSTGWILLVALPYHTIMEFSNNTIEVIFFTDIILIFILVIIINLLMRNIVTRHLSNLTAVMHQISAGKLYARVPVTGNDEFAELAKLFNQLAEIRENYTNTMEEEIRKRTEAISALQQENIRLRVLEEKERIFRNLHDSLGARLTNIFISNNVAKTVSTSDISVLEDMLTRIEKNTDLAIEDLKEIIFEHGDQRTIIDFTRFFFGTIKNRLKLKDIELKYKIKQREAINSIPRHIRFEIEHILQELVTNVLKHSGASVVTIDVRVAGNKFMLLFKDNGKGFDKDTITDGYGLTSVRERITTINGTIKIKTSSGSGVRYLITIPIRNTSND